ncbi:toxin co-regulated pilus biosynthesis Q family protein [Photorhabdus luminescens]|uniref:toxin co-regulated pilus biosynthesis Q family protein n=1 Tax=Photorhabdus luminescens TaxID=29488 RepID=UPI00223F86A0|nr:toxin co-regulated pilus biosynthesis Q family protein [Photorhabdus luminescens]MCW7760540.1 toxin co-regulated pilus biosynthesis Q family protein [Photorhabdus luminescens subsp. venezuelensis]
MNKIITYVFTVLVCMSSVAVYATPMLTPVPAAAVWAATPGQTLRDVTQEWASRSGYQVVWDASYDFPIRASLRFNGTFIHAVSELFEAYTMANRPFVVDIYQEQRLVHVQARG